MSGSCWSVCQVPSSRLTRLFVAALEVLGTEAADIWGHQWIKILQLIYEGTSVGIFGQDKKMIGGDSAEGHAAKARVQMEVERLDEVEELCRLLVG